LPVLVIDNNQNSQSTSKVGIPLITLHKTFFSIEGSNKDDSDYSDSNTMPLENTIKCSNLWDMCEKYHPWQGVDDEALQTSLFHASRAEGIIMSSMRKKRFVTPN
jgi:hypothetical protein